MLVFFPWKIFFEKNLFNEVVGVFFLFLKLPTTRRFQVCRAVGVLYNTCVGCHRSSEAGGGGFASRCRLFFQCVFRYSLTHSYFSQQQLGFLSDKISGLFEKWLTNQSRDFFPRIRNSIAWKFQKMLTLLIYVGIQSHLCPQWQALSLRLRLQWKMFCFWGILVVITTLSVLCNWLLIPKLLEMFFH